MKKFLSLILLLVAFVINAMAYTPILIKGYSWNIVNRNAMLDANGTIVYKTIVEKVEGDTIINEMIYKKLWHTTDADLTQYELIGIVREDVENQKVYAFIDDKEYLVYDFACNAGDKITTLTTLFCSEQTELTIKSIETITDLDGNEIKKFIASTENSNTDVIFYERYGSENGWYMRQYSENVGGGINFMICAFNTSNELTFKPTFNNELDEIKNCYINETKTDVPNIKDQPESAYYNSENHMLSFNIENPTIITIYDTMGKMVMNYTVASDTKSLPLTLNSGIYIAKITTDKQQSVLSKIIVK